MILTLTCKINCVLMILLAFTGPLLAGPQAPDQGKAKVEIRAGIIGGAHTEMPPEATATLELGLELIAIKDRPFQADLIVATDRKLADGNSVQLTTKGVVYRDRQGRVRVERTILLPRGSGQSAVEDTTISIVDHEKRIRYFLLPRMKAALKTQIPAPFVRDIDLRRIRPWTTQPSAPSMPLGYQMMEGIQCEGRLETVTIPAGSIGNSYPIEVTTERWYSEELQINLIVKRIDPRTGETTIRLMNFRLEEPSETLFEIPRDFEIRESTTTEIPIGEKERPVRRPL